jgi:hypothetical protein
MMHMAHDRCANPYGARALLARRAISIAHFASNVQSVNMSLPAKSRTSSRDRYVYRPVPPSDDTRGRRPGHQW